MPSPGSTTSASTTGRSCSEQWPANVQPSSPTPYTPIAPCSAEALKHVGLPETRNRGTVGGSLVHNDPAAEIGAVALACNAEVVLRSSERTRTERAADFSSRRL